MPHREDEHWQAERCADPQAPRHVAQLRVFLFAAGENILRFQRHPADRAIPWVILLDLGMHRAGVDRLRLFAESRIAFQRHSAFRTTAGRVALHPFAHRAEILFRRLARAHGYSVSVSMMMSRTASVGDVLRSLIASSSLEIRFAVRAIDALCGSSKSSFALCAQIDRLSRPPWPITQARASSVHPKNRYRTGVLCRIVVAIASPDETWLEEGICRRPSRFLSATRRARGFKKNGLPKRRWSASPAPCDFCRRRVFAVTGAKLRFLPVVSRILDSCRSHLAGGSTVP